MLEILARSDEPLTTADVCRLAKCSPVPIQALQKHGTGAHSIRRRLPLGLGHALAAGGRPDAVARGPSDRPAAAGGTPAQSPESSLDRSELILTAEQAATLARIEPVLESGGFAPFLIHGVTGSGKTEVYLSAIERVVARGWRRSCWSPRSA